MASGLPNTVAFIVLNLGQSAEPKSLQRVGKNNQSICLHLDFGVSG